MQSVVAALQKINRELAEALHRYLEKRSIANRIAAYDAVGSP